MIKKTDIHRPPKPGTAVCALVKRYRENLSFYIACHASDSRALALKKCCDEIVKAGEQ